MFEVNASLKKTVESFIRDSWANVKLVIRNIVTFIVNLILESKVRLALIQTYLHEPRKNSLHFPN